MDECVVESGKEMDNSEVVDFFSTGTSGLWWAVVIFFNFLDSLLWWLYRAKTRLKFSFK
jgi:hypothetical protein